jgi:hypothetical protein
MADKRNSAADESAEVFRQFAWHLAGSLATGAGGATPRKETSARPAKATGRR